MTEKEKDGDERAIGAYDLRDRVGAGASGVVWRARHRLLGKDFAVKVAGVAALSPEGLARFSREAEALGKLAHPNLVTVTDFGFEDGTGRPYLVTELLEGETLEAAIRRDGAMPLTRALPVLAGIAAGVDAAHAAGVLHRDLKPANVVLARGRGDDVVPKVLDFGMARVGEGRSSAPPGPVEFGSGDASLTEEGTLLGTPVYVAPEIVDGAAASNATDVYSFGALACEVLAGRPPFGGTVREVLNAKREGTFRPPRDGRVPDEVWRALAPALERDPVNRPPTASGVVKALEAGARDAAIRAWTARERPRRRALAAVFGILAALGGLRLADTGTPLDRIALDRGFRIATARPADPRLLLVTLDDAGFGRAPGLLSHGADEAGRTLRRVLEAGARSVAVDLVLPAAWSSSRDFSELLLAFPKRLTLAASATEDGRVLGPACVSPLVTAALGPEAAASLFGFVNLVPDADERVRRVRAEFPTREGPRPSWAGHVVRNLEGGALPKGEVWLDRRVDPRTVTRVRWADLSRRLETDPSVVRGKVVLVGGAFAASGEDVHSLGEGLAPTTGLEAQALAVHTLLAGRPVRAVGAVPAALVAGALAASFAWLALLDPRARRAGGLAVLAGASAYLSAAAAVEGGWLLPASALALPPLASTLVSLAVRRALPSRPSKDGHP